MKEYLNMGVNLVLIFGLFLFLTMLTSCSVRSGSDEPFVGERTCVGDLNGDYVVSDDEASLLMQLIVDGAIPPDDILAVSDYNKDGVLDHKDSYYILRNNGLGYCAHYID